MPGASRTAWLYVLTGRYPMQVSRSGGLVGGRRYRASAWAATRGGPAFFPDP